MLLLRLLWQIPAVVLALAILLLFINEYAVAHPSRRLKDLAYVAADQPDFNPDRHVLDVYEPKARTARALPVVLFIHGGNWDSGNKNIYSFIGRRLAKQGIVAVVINYRLAPGVQVPAMLTDCARAVAWVTKHIAEYGGDPNRMFVMGHSAGAGLAARLAVEDQLFAQYGLSQNPIKGAILDDPAGLDMFDYLKKMEYPNDEQYLVPFGKEPTVWRAMSALYHVRSGSPPMLLFVGERTYPSIASSSQRFRQRLQQLGVPHEYKVIPGKKHIGMVTQLFWKNNIIYRDLLKLVNGE
ncbi:alpha/beta hydrolase [Spirosoma fluminis]